MAALRELVLKLSANTVEFSKEIGIAIRDVGRFSSEVTRSMRSANAVLTGFIATAAGAVTLDLLAEQVEKTTVALATLVDMSQKTGSSITSLSQLQKVAEAFGGDSSAINLALNNLARGMSATDEEASKTRNALEQLGIETTDLAQQDPSAVFIRVAQTLHGYQDGAGKAAVVTDLFKRNAADLLPFLNSVAEHLDEFSGVSVEAAQRGKAFEDSLGILRVRAAELRESLVTTMLPAFSDFTGALEKIISEEAKLGQNSTLAAWAETLTLGLTHLIDVAQGVVRLFQLLGHTLGAAAAMANADSLDEAGQVFKLYRQQLSDWANTPLLGTRIRDEMERQRTLRVTQGGQGSEVTGEGTEPQDGKNAKGQLKYQSVETGREAEDAARRLAENDSRDLQRRIEAEATLLAGRNRMLDAYNADNLISIHDYYAARQAAQEQSLRASESLIHREIAVQQAFLKEATTDANRQQAQEKIRELKDKEIELQRQASEATVLDKGKERKAYVDLATEISHLNAQLLELQGRAGEAAQLRLTGQYRDVRLRFNSEGNQPALDLVDRLQRAQVAQAEFNQFAEQGAQVQERLRLAEERAALMQYTGAASELQTMAQISAARQQAVRELEQIVAKLEQVALASQNPALLVQAEAARTALERLRAESDLLARKFQTIFSGSMADALTEFATGAKSAKEAFKSFADSVVLQITRLASEGVALQLYQKLFGVAGGAAGGSLLGAIGGAGAAGTGAGGSGAGGPGMGGTGIGGMLGTIGQGLLGLFGLGGSVGAGAAAGKAEGLLAGKAATADLFPPGPAMSLADLNNFPGLASGGPVAANRPYWVGEFGKEVFVPDTDGRIVPRSQLETGSTNVINITQHIPRDMSRQSASQLAAETGLHVNRALRRNT